MSPTWSPDGQQIAFLSKPGRRLGPLRDARDRRRRTAPHPRRDRRRSRLVARRTLDRRRAQSPDRSSLARRPPSAKCSCSERAIRPGRQTRSSPSSATMICYIREVGRQPSGCILSDADQPHWSCRRTHHRLRPARNLGARRRQRRAAPAHAQPRRPVARSIQFDGDILFVRNAELMIIHQDDSMTDISYLPSPAGAPAPHPLEIDTVAFHHHDGGNWDIVTASLEHGNPRRLTRATWTSWNARL